MSILIIQQQLEKILQNILTSNSRIIALLNNLTPLFNLIQTSEQKTLILRKNWKRIQNYTTSVTFKWLILLNKLIIDNSLSLDDMLMILEQSHLSEVSEVDNFFNSKLIKPYRIYLMKRCQYYPKDSSQLDRMYQLFNLIQAGTSFSEIIYTLGRYYHLIYQFAVDFNIVLGYDLKIIYDQMINCIPKPVTNDILIDFQHLHEKLYIIYYNCYYHKYLKLYVPVWIMTDSQKKASLKSTSKLNNLKSNKSMNKSMLQTNISFNISSYKSSDCSLNNIDLSKSIFQFPAQRQKHIEQSLLLLKSMERVFELIEDI